MEVKIKKAYDRLKELEIFSDDFEAFKNFFYDNLKEDRKDERTKLQATQQSKLIEQRKKDLPSINFESTNDSLDSFSLAEFEPR